MVGIHPTNASTDRPDSHRFAPAIAGCRADAAAHSAVPRTVSDRRGFKTPNVLASSRQPWIDHSEKMAVRLAPFPHGSIFDTDERAGVSPPTPPSPNHPNPARGEIIKPGVLTPGMTAPPKEAEPRKGRNHKARRVNAGNDGLPREKLRPARGEIIKPGVSTPGMMGPNERNPAPQGATS